ncbi:hypothetical protein PSPO01_15864 [Paraphaeosphaeria sporulosa]
MGNYSRQQSNSQKALSAYGWPIKSAKPYEPYSASKKAVLLHKEDIGDEDLSFPQFWYNSLASRSTTLNAVLLGEASCCKKDWERQCVFPLHPLFTRLSPLSNLSVFHPSDIIQPRSPIHLRSIWGIAELSCNDDVATGDKKTSQHSEGSLYFGIKDRAFRHRKLKHSI